MTLIYQSGFSVGSVASVSKFTATVAGSAATITAGTYVAGGYDLSTADAGIYGSGQYTPFTTAVKSAFDTATSSTFTVSFSQTTGKYTISRATNFTLAFSGSDGTRLQQALGFTGTSYSGANTYTGEEIAKYVLIPSVDARSQVSDVYEPEDIVEEAISDGGRTFAVARRTSELRSDWTQSMEPYSRVFYRGAMVNLSHGWSWQSFIEHHRGTHPFVVWDSGREAAYQEIAYLLRADGGFFKPRRQDADFDDYWHVDIRTRDLGIAAI